MDPADPQRMSYPMIAELQFAGKEPESNSTIIEMSIGECHIADISGQKKSLNNKRVDLNLDTRVNIQQVNDKTRLKDNHSKTTAKRVVNMSSGPPVIPDQSRISR